MVVNGAAKRMRRYLNCAVKSNHDTLWHAFHKQLQGDGDMRFDCETHIGRLEGDLFNWVGNDVSAERIEALLDEFALDMCVVAAPTSEYPDNKLVADQCSGHQRFVPNAVINPNGPGGGVPELERCIHEWGMKGVKLQPQRHGYEVDGSTANRVMEFCEQHGLSIAIHSGDRCCLPWQVGQIARRFPTVPVIMNHMGFRYYVDGAINVALETPNIYLDTVLVSMPGYLKMAVDKVGADRIIYGSDFPVGHPSSAIAALKAANVGAEAEKLIMGDNLARIMKVSG
jgi:predicted TIM-barrel fold metal-dependent hydrolase